MSKWDELVRIAKSASIPAPRLRAVTLAQWILESGRGTSPLSAIHNNFAGLRWREEMNGFATPIIYDAHDGTGEYCAFASPEAFIPGYWHFIGRSVYTGWQAFSDDPAGYIAFLKSRGYSVAPDYVAKVLKLLPEAEALIGEPADPAAEPDRPSRSELGPSIDDLLDPAEQPQFVTLPEISHKWQGRRAGGLEGAIVHYDAGRRRPAKGPDDTEWGARNTLLSGQANGYAYVTVSRTGKIYIPGNMDWLSWGYHAGESKCPVTKRPSVSQYYVGFEVNCPGFVFPIEGDDDLFAPWFETVRDSKGNTILNTDGRARLVKTGGETYRRNELRHVAAVTGNIRPGAYVPYTDKQYQALVSAMLWLKRSYRTSFRLDLVFGHDEVSPLRKIDPGGSLGTGDVGSSAMTMAAFRAVLLKGWADQQAMV